jgi:hypothetical protein
MARRPVNVFSLSFLDVMSCGFGAIVLIYLIINHATEQHIAVIKPEARAEIRKLDFEVQNGQKHLTELRQSIDATERRIDEATRHRIALLATISERSDQLSTLDADTLAKQADLAQLRADVKSKEEDVKRLEAQEQSNEGNKARTFVGEGDRQYLTGLKIGGERILVAFDTSASMLDDTIVNVVRRSHMDDTRKKASPKWVRTVAMVEWFAAQFPLDSKYQIYGFNESTKPMVDGTEGKWLDVADTKQLDRAIDTVKATVPAGGTNLSGLVTAITAMSPPPDNIYLITDGLPTMDSGGAKRATVTGRQRMKLFNEAVRHLPHGIPINVILLPLEGDPAASGVFWDLAQGSGGAYLAPAADWP